MIDGERPSSLCCIVLSDTYRDEDPKKKKRTKDKSKLPSRKKPDKPASKTQDPFDFDKLDGIF